MTDNATVTYFFENEVTAKSRGSVDRSMGGLDTTDLNTSYDTTPVFSGSGETDVVYRQKPQDFDPENDPSDGIVIGTMWCDDPVGGTNYYACDQAYVNFRQDAVWALACHETGHAIGLLHGNNQDPRLDKKDQRIYCMVTPLNRDMNTYGPLNVENINYVY